MITDKIMADAWEAFQEDWPYEISPLLKRSLRKALQAVDRYNYRNPHNERYDNYWPDDGCYDSVYDCPADAFGDQKIDAVVKCGVGRYLGEIWITRRVLSVDEDGYPDDTEIVEFDNYADAKNCYQESLERARCPQF